MAIKYINAGALSRSKGHNAVKSAAYRANEELYCERTGKTYDYTGKGDCVYKNILLPDSAYTNGFTKENHPFNDRGNLWNAVEEIENSHNRRATALLSMELKVALPKELSREQQIDLINSFVKDHYLSRFNIAADVCIHDKGDNNPHAHVMFTFREINGNEFCKTKLRNLMPQVRGHSSNYFVIADQLSQQWEDYQNKYFQKHDIDLVVDQGHIKPTIHEGRIDQPDNYAETQAQKNVEIIKENIEAVKENHEVIIDTLEKRQAVFSQRDIENLIFKSTESKEDYNETLAKVLESEGLVNLGYYNEAGRLSFTTKHTYEKEVKLAKMANEMSGVHSFNIHSKIIDEIAAHKDFTLFEEQKSALTHIVNSGQIVALVGIAGAGKTRTMSALKAVYDSQGIYVSGAAMAGKAEHGLQAETGIKSQTIYRILDNYRKGESTHKYLPRHNSVLVIDEAGMIGLEDMYDLVKMSQERNIKLVLVGDPDQLQPVSYGAPFRAILERIGFAEMTDVIRQKDKLDALATQALAKGEISLAVDHYLKKDRLVLDDDSVIKKQLLSTWQGYINEKPENTLILAFKNEQVAEINALARDYLKQQGVLGESKSFNVSVSGKDEVRDFAANDRIIFLKNKNLGDVKVKNGQLATIVAIENDIVTFRLDGDKDATDVRHYQFNAKEFNNFDHGYCATVHKSQGVSVENCLVYAKGRGWDRFLSYVAMSRHKINMHFFADKDTYKDIHMLKRELSRSPLRDNVLDYPLQFAIRRGRDAQTFAGNAVAKIRGAYHKTRDTWNYLFNYEGYKASKAAFDRESALNEKLNAQQELNKEARAVADLADLHIDSGQRYSEFVEKYGKKWYENAEAKAAYNSEVGDLFYERNKAAFAVFTKADKYERALELNNISLEKLEEWANAYIAESRVRAFGDSTNPYEKGKLAQDIVNTKDESASYVSRQALWQEVNKYQSEHALRMKAGQIQGFSACLKDVEEYLSLGKTAANYWKKSQADHFDSNSPMQKDSKGKEIKPEHQQHYEKLSRAYNQKCEILAAKMMADFNSYSKVFAVKFPHAATHDKIIERLKANADRHAKREVIRSYINPKSTLTEIEKAAFKLKNDFKGYVGLGFEEGLIWANVGKLAQAEKLRQFKENLSPENQVRFDRVEAYRLSVVATGKAYGEVQQIEQALKAESGIPEKGDIPHDKVTEALQTAREAMYKVIADCHEVAYDLAQDYPYLAKWAKNAPEKLLEVHPYFEKLSRHTKAANHAKSKQQSVSDAPQETQEKTMADLKSEVRNSLEKQKAQLDRADNLNKSKVNTVKADKFTRHILLHAERLEAQERVENFVALSNQPSNDANRAALASLAYEMTDRIHKHRFFLKQAEINEREIWHLSQVHQYNLDNAELTGDDKAVHRALADYMLSRGDSSRAWSDYSVAKNTYDQEAEKAKELKEAADKKGQPETNNKDKAPVDEKAQALQKQKLSQLEKVQKHAFNLSTERNRLAFEASKLLGTNINSNVLDAFTFSGEEIDLASKDNNKLSSKALHARIKTSLTRANKQNLNLQTLIKEAQSYSIIDAIERYKLEESGSYKARSIAGEASEQYNSGQLYHKLKELGADRDAFYADAVSFKRQQYRDNLTADERQAHDIVVDYVEKSDAAYKAYTAKNEALNKALMPEVEKLAAQIVQSYSYYEDALLFESVRLNKLEQDANRQYLTDQLKHYKLMESNTEQSIALVGALSQEYKKGFVYHKLQEIEIDTRAYYKDVHSFERAAHRATLNDEQKAQHDVVLSYIDSVVAVAQAYSSGDKKQGLALIGKRDELAAQIHQDLSSHSDALAFEKVKLDKLEKHAERYFKQQEKQEQQPFNAAPSFNELEPDAYYYDHGEFDLGNVEDSISEYYQQSVAVKPINDAPVISTRKTAAFEAIERAKKWNAELINDELMANPVATYTDIFGEPKKQTSKEMRWSGGLIVTLTGQDAGKWYDFGSGKGGYPVQALMHESGLGYREALEKGAYIAGLSESQAQVEDSIERIQAREQKAQQRAALEKRVEAQKLESVQSIWNATIPAENTIVEEYMAVHRNVYDISNTTLRLFPTGAKWVDYVEDEANQGQYKRVEKTNKIPAMVIASTDKDGNVIGVQRTYLDKETANKAAFMDTPKLSKGSIRNGATLQVGDNGKVYIAEGIETAASVALADRNATVLVSMSVSNMENMIGKVKGFKPSEVVLLKDNDGEKAKTDETFNKALNKFEEAGLKVTAKEPEMLQRIVEAKGDKAKTDWNDVIQEKGLYSLCDDLQLPEPKADRNYLVRLYNAKNPNVRIKADSPEAKSVIKHVMLENKCMRGIYKSEHAKILTEKEKDELFKASVLAVRKSAYDLVTDVRTNKYLDNFEPLKKRMYKDAEKYVNQHLHSDARFSHSSTLSKAKISDHDRHIAAIDKSLKAKSDMEYKKSRKHTKGLSY